MENTVTFICTGHGGLGVHDAVTLQTEPRRDGVQSEGRRQGNRAVEVHCPSCDRMVLVGYKVMQKLQQSGLAQVDISLLPI